MQTEKPVLIVNKAESYLYLKGNTFLVKDKLKQLGFKWDKEDQVWYKEVEDAEGILNKLKEFADVRQEEFDLRGSPLGKINDKEYVIFQNEGENVVNDFKRLPWAKRHLFRLEDLHLFTLYRSSIDNKTFYLLINHLERRKYLLRDDSRGLEGFVTSLESFIMKDIPKQLGAKKVIYWAPCVQYFADKEAKERSFSFSFNDFKLEIELDNVREPCISIYKVNRLTKAYIAKNFTQSILQKEFGDHKLEWKFGPRCF